ncbi:hypothetical protein [Bradyrhizobium sacchari]|uniref:hypothetical protein n=1 Tax=Bradyrhizobium sacchari TaxID=1399419 RepID=UPI0010A95413|nr:hypothetical protein [Bradyrhizobium sacchari]
MPHLKEIAPQTDQQLVMARLARKIGWGHDAIYHGTRALPSVLRAGALLPSTIGDIAVFFTRSPEVAAYWADMVDDNINSGILVLNRQTLCQSHRLQPSRYTEDWNDEREEAVWGRRINFRRHLLGIVRPADADAVIGRLSLSGAVKVSREQTTKRLAMSLARQGRTRVREVIVRQREAALRPV